MFERVKRTSLSLQSITYAPKSFKIGQVKGAPLVLYSYKLEWTIFDKVKTSFLH
jgi:hypothetical protein